MVGAEKSFRSHAIVTGGLLLAGVIWLVWQVGLAGGLPQSGAYRVNALVPTAASLAPNSRVTMAGVEVGRVRSVDLRGTSALIQLSITDDAVTPLPADSQVAVRQHTSIGENYVSITRGKSAKDVPQNGTLPVHNADEYVDVDQILSVLQGDTRLRARQMIQSLGTALSDRGRNLNQTFSGTADFLASTSRLTAQISDEGPHIARLIDNFGALSRSVGERGEAVRTLAQQGKIAMSAIAARDDSLRATIDALPATLTQVGRTSTDIADATKASGPVLANLATALEDLQPAIGALRPAADEGRGVLRSLAAATPPLRETLARVRSLAGPTQDAMPALRKTFCQLNPALDYLRPYAPEIVGTMSGLGSASNTYDAIGHKIRVVPIVTDNALTGLPPELSKAAAVLLHGGLLQQIRGQGWDPYPKPGSLGQTETSLLGVNGPSEYPRKYTRVTAEC